MKEPQWKMISHLLSPYKTNLLFTGKISPVGNILFHEGL